MKSPVLLTFLAVLALFACQKKTEGCLDAEAKNFQVDADRSCDGCCEYPKLQLDLAFSNPFDSLRRDARGELFRLKSLTFYVSEVALKQADGSLFWPEDSVRLRLFPDSAGQFLRRDFALLKNSQRNFPVGSMVAKGEFEGLVFSVGLGDAANRAIPKLAPADSPLALQTEKMWTSPDSAFLFFKLVLKKDTAAATAETAFVFEKTAGKIPVDLAFLQPKTFKKGKNAAVTLLFDLNKLLAGADFSKSDAANLAAFRSALPSAFEAR